MDSGKAVPAGLPLPQLLGLTGLQAQFADIVNLLRSEDYTVPQLQAKLAAVKNDWQRTLQYIEELESA